MSKTTKDKNLDAVKKAKSWENFTRESMRQYAEKHEKFEAVDVLTLLIESMKENCEYNFFGCNDTEGEHLAFDLETISDAFGFTSPTCEEICSNGCCAYINKVLYGIGKKICVDEAKE